MNQRAFFTSPARASAQLALAAAITGHPTKNPAQGRAFCWLSDFGRLVSGPGSGSVDLASGWGLTLLAMSRVLVLLARFLAGVLALLTAALVALLVLLVLVWILLVCHRLVFVIAMGNAPA